MAEQHNSEGVVVLRFPAPNNPLSINKSYNMHWAARKKLLDPWREAAWAAWNETSLYERREVMGKPCTVEVHLPFKTEHRRDPHNYTPTQGKVIIDTLVRCGVWEDDTAEWVTVLDPVLKVGGDCLVVLRRRESGSGVPGQ